MKKIDLNFELKDLDGVFINTAGKLVAKLLMTETKGDAEKLFDWAMKFNSTEVVEVDASDLNKLKELIKTTDRISIIVKGPIIKYLQTIN